MECTPSISSATAADYQHVNNLEDQSVDKANNPSATGDSTAPRLLGRGTFSLFGIGFNLFGNSGKACPAAKSDVSISTPSFNSPSDDTQPKTFLGRIIKAFSFGTSTTDSSSAQGTKGTSLLSLFRSKIFGSSTVSINIDGQEDGGTKADIKRQGSSKIKDSKSLTNVTDDLNATNKRCLDTQHPKETEETEDAETKEPTLGYLDSFDVDASRIFTHSLIPSSFCSSSITNRDMQRPKGSNYYKDITKDPKVVKAHTIINTIAEAVFPDNSDKSDSSDNEIFRKTLGANLKGISQQALFATPLLVFNQYPPSNGSCLVQGGATGVDFSYSITGPKEITIKATSSYLLPYGNTLFGVVDHNATPLSSRDLYPTGTISLDIVATIGDDGKITKLNCTSMETSWDIKDRNVTDLPGATIITTAEKTPYGAASIGRAPIPKEGNWTFSETLTPDAPLTIINAKLEELRTSPSAQTFTADVGRGTRHTNPKAKNSPKINSTPHQKAGHAVETFSEEVFPDNKSASTRLKESLQGICHQGIAAGLIKTFNDGKVPGAYLGTDSALEFTYIKMTGESRRFNIKIRGDYSNNNLFSGNPPGKDKRPIILGGRDDQHATGSFFMNLEAEVDDDGNITALICKEAQGDWHTHDTPLPLKEASLSS